MHDDLVLATALACWTGELPEEPEMFSDLATAPPKAEDEFTVVKLSTEAERRQA
jgi:hypothetical protein